MTARNIKLTPEEQVNANISFYFEILAVIIFVLIGIILYFTIPRTKTAIIAIFVCYIALVIPLIYVIVAVKLKDYYIKKNPEKINQMIAKYTSVANNGW
jgi:glucan phosphoethanolaminetransferase (alkaline phosphatase superfamily)